MTDTDDKPPPGVYGVFARLNPPAHQVAEAVAEYKARQEAERARMAKLRQLRLAKAAGEPGGEALMHKFILGQAVAYQPPSGTFVPSGTWVVTAKLPERNGECYYRIYHAIEQHELVVREGELTAIAKDYGRHPA